MGNLLSYSGLITKIRAMKSYLLTDDQYRELAEISTVPLAVAYLKQRPAYSRIWDSLGEDDLHRGQIEKFLTNSVYNDFARIYRFANQEQRVFLDLYFKRYEISILKSCLNRIFDHRNPDLDLSYVQDFFDRHSCLDIQLLTTGKSVGQFVDNLQGTEYSRPLSTLRNLENPTLFDYETTLDLYYFGQIWKVKDKLFRKTDLEELTSIFGHKFDLLNLQWIHRSRSFYHADPDDIRALLLPVHYRLKQEELYALTEAESDPAFEALLDQTWYGRRYEHLSGDTLEYMYTYIMRNTLAREAKRNPYSAASIYQYLYLKDHEIRRLTVALECIRYGIPPEVTIQHIMKF